MTHLDKYAKRAAALACAALLAACTRDPASAAFGPLATATLTAGTGLGDLRLGTSLEEFIGRYGTGRLGVKVSDEQQGLELSFEQQGLAFQFDLRQDCLQALAPTGNGARELMRLAREPGLLKTYPACAASPLQSIAVGLPPNSRKPFFVGATDHGTRLMGDGSAVLAGPPDWQTTSPMLAGDRSDDNQYQMIPGGPGLVYFVQPAASATGQTTERTVRRIVVYSRGLATAAN
jgi:hypothetical protein